MIINIVYVVCDLFFFYSVNYSHSFNSSSKHFKSLPEITRSEKLTTSKLLNFLLKHTLHI